MSATTNHMHRLPSSLQEYIPEFLQPTDILTLLLVNHSFKIVLNEDFWKRYSEKRGYENWSPVTISWCRATVACFWNNKGREQSTFSLTGSLIEKAAKLGHPKARSDIAAFEAEIKRRKKFEKVEDRNSPTARIYYPLEKHQYYPIIGPSSHARTLSYYARSSKYTYR